MKASPPFHSVSLCVLRALAAIVLCAAVLVPGRAPAATQWFSSLEEGMRVREQSRKPAMVVFYNNRARDCWRVSNMVLKDPQVSPMLENFVCFSINTDRFPNLVEEHNIFKVPTTIFLDPAGKEIDRAIGYKDPGIFTKYLERTNEASLTQAAAASSGGEVARAASIRPFDTATINVLVPHPGFVPFTLSLNQPSARNVFLVGDFNDWRTDAIPMQRAATGEWFQTIYVPPGIYEYMFLVNGADYVRDERNPMRKPNPYGGMNSVLVIGNQKYSPQIQGNNVTFYVYRPEAATVEVAGSFNDWQPLTMYRNPQQEGMWGVRFTLPPGQYQYKFLIDSEWMADPENYSPVEDGSGNINSAFVIR